MNTTNVDKLIFRIKNNPILSVLIVCGIIVISMSSFTNALKDLKTTANDVIGPSEPVDISGYWQTNKSSKIEPIYFEFKVVKNKLYGSVWLTPTFAMQNSQSGILNGQIEGNHFTFTTKHEFVKSFGRANWEKGHREPDVMAFEVHKYEGEFKDGRIFLSRVVNGNYTSIILSKEKGFKIKLIGSGFLEIGNP